MGSPSHRHYQRVGEGEGEGLLMLRCCCCRHHHYHLSCLFTFHSLSMVPLFCLTSIDLCSLPFELGYGSVYLFYCCCTCTANEHQFIAGSVPAHITWTGLDSFPHPKQVMNNRFSDSSVQHKMNNKIIIKLKQFLFCYTLICLRREAKSLAPVHWLHFNDSLFILWIVSLEMLRNALTILCISCFR